MKLAMKSVNLVLKYIMDQIEELKGKRTIIVITHKLSTLANCNKIYKIEDKKIKLFKEK